MTDWRNELIVGRNLPRWARRHNLRLGAAAAAREKREYRHTHGAAAERFTDRCWVALLAELQAWADSVGPDGAVPTQGDADAIMARVYALPLHEQARFEDAPDAGLRAFLAALVKEHREPAPEPPNEAANGNQK
ncbi:MAG: hypothetical protein OEV94_12100 [Deltaproteobacteria bacterium]|nr:hypothetical protein [Deltaproteobacteria bacterium]